AAAATGLTIAADGSEQDDPAGAAPDDLDLDLDVDGTTDTAHVVSALSPEAGGEPVRRRRRRRGNRGRGTGTAGELTEAGGDAISSIGALDEQSPRAESA
ncbi:ATP-dependent helicase, partial [Frankia sp. AiPs1]|nr:ATP-dependent helicase [Frankia sp. AiPs1]